jgi:hypothetical protein
VFYHLWETAKQRPTKALQITSSALIYGAFGSYIVAGLIKEATRTPDWQPKRPDAFPPDIEFAVFIAWLALLLGMVVAGSILGAIARWRRRRGLP